MSRISFTPQQVEDLLKEQIKIVKRDVSKSWEQSKTRKLLHSAEAEQGAESDTEIHEIVQSLNDCKQPNDLAIIKKYSQE